MGARVRAAAIGFLVLGLISIAETGVAAPPTAGTFCSQFKALVDVAERGSLVPGAPFFKRELVRGTLPKFGFSANEECHAYANGTPGGFTAGCTNKGSSRDWALKLLQTLSADARKCLPGWQSTGNERFTLIRRPDNFTGISISIPDETYGPMVEVSASFEPKEIASYKHAQCSTMNAMSNIVRSGFKGVAIDTTATGGLRMATPLNGAHICIPIRKGPGRVSNALSCTWLVETPEPKTAKIEASAQSMFEWWSSLVIKHCRRDQTTFSNNSALGTGVIARQLSGDPQRNERWSVSLQGPAKGAPWSITITNVIRDVDE